MSRRSVVPFVICSLLLVGVCSLWAQPQSGELKRQFEELKTKQSRLEKSLSRTQQKKTQARRKLNRSAQQENHLLNLISNYRSLQEASKARLEKLRRREERAKKHLDRVEKKLDRLEHKMEKRRSMLKQRLRSIYKHGELMQTRILLSGSGMDDMMTNYRYYRQLIGHDREVIRDYRETQKELEELRSTRQRIFKRRRTIRANLQELLDKRRSIIQERREFLNKVRNKKSLYRRRLRELERQQQKLKNKVLRFQRQRSSTKQQLERILTQFGKRKGELPWPVQSREILRPYGTWRQNGIVHHNDGVDIKVQENAPVRSIASGRVVFANNYKGMGKVVIVRHNKKFISLYGSLVDIQVEKDESVDERMILGRAGRSPGMDSPRLYFQLFQGKETLDPTNWLR